MWLPITGLIAGDISFIRSNPDTTITMPGNAAAPMTAGGYNAGNGKQPEKKNIRKSCRNRNHSRESNRPDK